MSVPAGNRHLETTRRAILEAAAELLRERRNDGFSVQEVATQAGLTHRTVYRHFPSRLELMAATARSVAPGLGDDSYDSVSTVEEWIAAVGPHLARTEADLEIVRSLLSAMLSADDLMPFGQQSKDRDSHRWTVFRRQFAHLREDDARRTFATLRHLTSSTTYLFYRLRFGMSPADATEAIQSGASQIVQQAALRDQARGPDATR